MRKILILTLLYFLTFNCTKSENEAEILYDVEVSASEGGSVNTSGGSYPLDTELEILATPNENYEFSNWSGNASGNENPLIYTVTGNASISANFNQLITFSIEVNTSQGGTVNTNGGLYGEGETINLIATPSEGYEFSSWSINGESTSTNNELEYVVTEDAEIQAIFNEIITINFANTSVQNIVYGFRAESDLLVTGNVEIQSKGVYLDDQIITDESNNNSISIEKSDLSLESYVLRFFVQTQNGIIYSEEQFLVSPYSPEYNFNDLSHNLNSETTIADLSVSYSPVSDDAELDLIDYGFYLSTNQSTLQNNKVSSEQSNSILESQVSDLSGSTTYYYQAFIENQYGVFLSEISTFTTKASLGDIAQGGIIVEVDASGFHGKVVPITDYWVKKQWSTERCIAPNFKVYNSDKGQDITNKIVEFYLDKTASSPAAEYCFNLEIDGFDDWYLPNLEEINDAQYYLARNGYKQKIIETDGVWTCKNLIESGENVCRAQTSVYNNSSGTNPTARDSERYVIPMREF